MATTEQPLLALKRLEDHLWQAADLFRNKVSNQKDYILALGLAIATTATPALELTLDEVERRCRTEEIRATARAFFALR